jgi:hypothetical protein
MRSESDRSKQNSIEAELAAIEQKAQAAYERDVQSGVAAASASAQSLKRKRAPTDANVAGSLTEMSRSRAASAKQLSQKQQKKKKQKKRVPVDDPATVQAKADSECGLPAREISSWPGWGAQYKCEEPQIESSVMTAYKKLMLGMGQTYTYVPTELDEGPGEWQEVSDAPKAVDSAHVQQMTQTADSSAPVHDEDLESGDEDDAAVGGLGSVLVVNPANSTDFRNPLLVSRCGVVVVALCFVCCCKEGSQ